MKMLSPAWSSSFSINSRRSSSSSNWQVSSHAKYSPLFRRWISGGRQLSDTRNFASFCIAYLYRYIYLTIHLRLRLFWDAPHQSQPKWQTPCLGPLFILPSIYPSAPPPPLWTTTRKETPLACDICFCRIEMETVVVCWLAGWLAKAHMMMIKLLKDQSSHQPTWLDITFSTRKKDHSRLFNSNAK